MSLPLPEAVKLAVGFVRLDTGVERDRPFANVALEAQLRALHLLRLRKVRGFKIDAGELLATTATGSSLVGAHYWRLPARYIQPHLRLLRDPRRHAGICDREVTAAFGLSQNRMISLTSS